jgi:neutral ceramidase
VVLSLGCSTLEPSAGISGTVPKPGPAPASSSFQVGAARVDLTPIPGVGMSYNQAGKVSRGFWTRLHARAIYLRDKGGRAIVFVSVEVPAIPNGLRDRVAELVGQDGETQHLGRAQIILAATHTHHAPQNYFSSRYYNDFPSQKPGFDPELHEFLAGRIRDAIVEAAKESNLEPSPKIAYRKGRLSEFFRNRSFQPFLMNEKARELIDASPVSDACFLPEQQIDKDACKAVTASVEVVEFKGEDDKPIATAVFLAAHPTVLSTENEVLSGDLFGATSILLEQQRVSECADYAPPVVALFNGAEGDVSLDWQRRNRPELMDLAERLSRFICGEDEGVEPDADTYNDPEIALRFSWPYQLAAVSADEGSDCVPWHEHCTAKEPLPGLASMGGAQDGRTIWYDVGVKDSIHSVDRDKQGRKEGKLPLGPVKLEVAKLISNPDPELENVALGVYRVGSLVFVTLPGEFTTAMGERIREAIDGALGDPESRVVLIGLANGRVSYVTTPEEFDVQHYEGAQNLFGAATGPVIQKELVRLAGELSDAPQEPEAESFSYDPGHCRVALPSDAGLPPYHPSDGLQYVLPPGEMLRQCWLDAIPRHPRHQNACIRPVPYVWIERAVDSGQCSGFGTGLPDQPCDTPGPVEEADQCDPATDPRFCVDGKLPQDNCGIDVVTALHGSYRDRTRWCAFWQPPAGEEPDDYAVCVSGVTGENVMSSGGKLSGTGEVTKSFDTGSTNLFFRYLECWGVPTRNVCEFPELP